MSVYNSPADGMTMRTLGVFVGLTFALTWGLGALLFMAPAQVQAVFGPISYSNPPLVRAVYSPESPRCSWCCFMPDPKAW